MIPTAPFGRTGHESSRVIFGAAGLASMRQDRADEVLANLLRHGVNHIDTAASYGDSELRIGPWMADHRHDFFLATKTDGRTGARARADLERSLERLQVDQVDLIQLHNLVEPDEWETAHGPGGAVEALARARDEGLVRHIGVTGHGVRIARMHLRSLERFPFASVLLPYSYVALTDADYRDDVEELLGVCAANEVAVQTIKGVSRRRWRDDDEQRRFAWYEPLTEEAPLGPSGAVGARQPAGVPEHHQRCPRHGPGARHRRGRPRPSVRRRDAGRRRRSGHGATVRRRSDRAHLTCWSSRPLGPWSGAARVSGGRAPTRPR